MNPASAMASMCLSGGSVPTKDLLPASFRVSLSDSDQVGSLISLSSVLPALSEMSQAAADHLTDTMMSRMKLMSLRLDMEGQRRKLEKALEAAPAASPAPDSGVLAAIKGTQDCPLE